MRATRHAVKRYQQRVESVSDQEARAGLERLSRQATCLHRGVQSILAAKTEDQTLTLVVDSGTIITIY